MKTLEEIEKEYETYPIKTDVVTNLDEFLSFMEVGIDDTKEYQKDDRKELRAIKRTKTLEKIHDFLFFVLGVDDLELYDEDYRVVQERVLYTQKFEEFYKRIVEIATEENYKELTRLVDFSTDYYNAQSDYYEYLRDRIEMAAKGINMSNSRYEDTKDSFLAFMEQKLALLEKESKKQDVPKEYTKRRD